jgi:hypothetical protein
MMGAISREQESRRQGSDRQFGTMQQKLAYLGPHQCTTGLARAYIWNVVLSQPALQ